MNAIEEKIKVIKGYLSRNEKDKLMQFAKDHHPVDLADLISDLEREERSHFFSIISPEQAALVLPKMRPGLMKELLGEIEETTISRILEKMSSRDASGILEELPEKWAQQLLNLMKREKAEDVDELLGYKEDTAGRIMTPDFFALHAEMSVAEAIEELRKTNIHKIPYIYITTNDGYFIGVLAVRDLIIAAPNTKLSKIVNKDIVRVTVEVDQEEVANLVRKYHLRAIPVVDMTNKLVGIVTVDNILEIVTEEASEDIYYMAGIKEDGLLHLPILATIRLRLPWLVICLFGGMAAAGVVGTFEETIAAIVVLAAFMPVIMDMGGNVGTQSSTIVVRGLATRSINTRKIWRLLWRELRIGLSLGAICGVGVGVIAQIWKGTPDLGIVLGIAMAATITVAAFFGALLPVLCQRFGTDPAVASGPAITTIKDITGLLIYFGIATLIML
ncbi:magnesium transporter [Candidatus Acetothermia bacterium]|nr:magnesium transporter [Candidatus Acetothermia bacterium]